MRSYHNFLQQLDEMGLGEWAQQLRQAIPAEFSNKRHGKMPTWQKTLQSLPKCVPDHVELKDSVEIGSVDDLSAADREQMIEHLKVFHPWRKGPFRLFDIDIDTEWRSDWKWDRLLPHIQPLPDRTVLDVGCGNGYHGWRMRGEGAGLVVGIDPVMLYVLQFRIMQQYLNDPRHHVLPMKIEDLPSGLNCFDTVFSMGVLYHRRSPFDHLLELKGCLCSGGELVLETLVVEGGHHSVLVPEGRYAKMRNVWFVPSVDMMIVWLQRCGYEKISCVDVNQTCVQEQRRTDWMWEESLADFLSPRNPKKTIEGHPAPLRAMFIARKP